MLHILETNLIEKEMSFVKKNLGYFIIGFLIVGIGTCNFIVNTNDEQKLVDNPEPGHYYIFDKYLEGQGEIIMKIKEVRQNDIEFYISDHELIFGYKRGKSESTIKKADREGTMFSGQTISIPKSTIKELIDNNTLSGAANQKAMISAVFK